MEGPAVTDRPASCRDSADGRHHWEPARNLLLKLQGVEDDRAVILGQDKEGNLKGRLLMVCVDCGAKRLGEEVPIPPEIVKMFYSSTDQEAKPH